MPEGKAERASNQQLRLARQQKGWSQKQVATAIGTNAVMVSRWETGVMRPGPYFRQRLCALYGRTPEELGFVSAAAQEDVDAIGLSILSGAHLPICRRVVELLKEKRIEGVQVFVGGIIPAQDIPELKKLGIAEVFLPGASLQDVVRLVSGAVPAR